MLTLFGWRGGAIGEHYGIGNGAGDAPIRNSVGERDGFAGYRVDRRVSVVYAPRRARHSMALQACLASELGCQVPGARRLVHVSRTTPL